MESTWKTQAACWEPSVPTQFLLQAKRAHPRGTPNPTVKKHKPITRHSTILEGWLDGPCKIHTTPDTIPTHSLRACWILWKVAKSSEDLHTKRALHGLAEVCQIAAINPWNDTAITFNAGDEPRYRTV